MADEQPDSCHDASGENQAVHDLLKNKNVQKIQQLMYQDKTAAITEVVNLTFITLKQQNVITLLNKKLKEESEKNDELQKNSFCETQYTSALPNVVEQTSCMASKLNSECEHINARLKSCERNRTQLKNDVAVSREAMEKLIKNLNEMKEKVNKQAMEYGALMTRYNTCKSELTGRIEQLKGQNDAQSASYNETTTKYELTMKEREAEAMEFSAKLNGMNEKLCKLQSETDQSTKLFEQLKLSSEQALSDLKQKRTGLEKDMKERHDEQVLNWNKDICQLEEKKQLLESEKRALEEQERVLIEANERFKEEEEQFKLRSMQQVSKGETVGAGGTRKLSNVNPGPSFDVDCIESYHYENEMSLQLDPSSTFMLGRHLKKTKK